jgi:hypothetical protein
MDVMTGFRMKAYALVFDFLIFHLLFDGALVGWVHKNLWWHEF